MEDRQFGRIRFVCGENGGKYPFNHSLYIRGERSRVIIDPACSLEKLTRLKDEGVDCVWLSHWHEDHIRYLDLFENRSLRISGRDFPPLTDINIFLDWYDIKIPQERANWRKIMLEVFNFRPRHEANFLVDNETVDLGELTIQVLPTPGHTPGHLSFFFPEEELLFLGDYDLTSFGPWYGDVYSDIEETIKSIHKLKAVPARRWVASHHTGLFEENPDRLWNNYENVIHERENKLLAFLEKPKTLAEICAAWLIYGRPREPKEMYEFNERALVCKHLEYLQRQDKIILNGERYVKA